jgi:hypothetical protein
MVFPPFVRSFFSAYEALGADVGQRLFLEFFARKVEVTSEANSHEMQLHAHEMRQPWRPNLKSTASLEG